MLPALRYDVDDVRDASDDDDDRDDAGDRDRFVPGTDATGTTENALLAARKLAFVERAFVDVEASRSMMAHEVLERCKQHGMTNKEYQSACAERAACGACGWTPCPNAPTRDDGTTQRYEIDGKARKVREMAFVRAFCSRKCMMMAEALGERLGERADAVSAEARTLAEANRELERKNRELDEARGQALAAASNRSAFIANISHEIRTPLNAVLGMIELLGETELNREQREWLHLVEHSGQQLLHLVRDVLDFSKIEAGEITVNNEPFDITDCVEDAVTLTAFQSQQQGVEVAYDIGDGVPAQLLGDGWRVRQILLNYLQNAIKHGRGGQIEVRITRHPAPDGQAFIRFCVRDDGPGIPEQQLRQLFQRFSQLAGGERTDGAGLGLAISRHLAELMGGRVWGSSEMGEGSAFYLELPAREAASPPSPEEEAQRRFLAGRRVLVAERQPLTRQRLQGLLRGWGATVVCAESGEDVLTLFGRGEGFALALIDQQLPDMDCEELAGELRGSGRAGDCVLLLGTGMGDASSCPQDYRERYSKPLRRAALRATLQAALGLGEGQPRRDGDRWIRRRRGRAVTPFP